MADRELTTEVVPSCRKVNWCHRLRKVLRFKGKSGAPEGTILELFFGILCQVYRSSIHCQELRQQASCVLYDPVRGATCRSESEDLAAADTIRKHPAD